ncbi:MAG: FAM83 family protein [Cyclobacteriaceae bacterium]|nr:FAM83 family protein [Cyclobacteriaceae bacterium]
MEEIINQLKLSIEDEIFSRSEKKSIKGLIGEHPLDGDQLNFLRSKIYEIANEKATSDNYPFILEWIKNANSALLTKTTEKADAYFSPGDACRNTIINQIMYAINKINICVFTISDDRITSAILDSHRRGKEVRIITDNDKSLDLGSDIARLAKEGVAVKMDATPNHMHHKFMVVDDSVLVTGSYNWTLSAAKYNHENVLLTREGGVVKSFIKEFSQLWSTMEDYK